MDNKKHQFALECYSKMAKAREDLKAMLDIIGLPIEALNIDASIVLHTLSLLMMCAISLKNS